MCLPIFFQRTSLRDQWYRMGNKCVKEPTGNELKKYILFGSGNRISGGIKYVQCRLLKPSLSKRIVSGEKPA